MKISTHGFQATRAMAVCVILAFAHVAVAQSTGNKLRVPNFPPVDELPVQRNLPDPLVMLDGTRVTSAQQWTERRRPELKALFQHYMYGYTPPSPGITSRVMKTDSTLFGGKATLKEVEIRFNNLTGDDAPHIHLALFVPNGAKGPLPVFLGLHNCGNHTVVDHPSVTIDEDAWCQDKCPQPKEKGRGVMAGFWAVENTIDRGWAFATFHQSDIDPDKHDFTDGVHAHYPDLPGPEQSRWGTIAAWAWGLQRGVDYLTVDPQVDPERICLIGHSRRGKTVLLAAAMDERVALVVPHQSGTGGAALSRNNDQETVERINRVFPHWFNDTFTQFNDNEDQLPFDQHCLMALVAPRPLLETAGLKDKWANYESALRSLQAADPVYKLLGARGLVGEGMLIGDEPMTREQVGELLQYRRNTRHTLNVDYWNAILDFAELQLSK